MLLCPLCRRSGSDVLSNRLDVFGASPGVFRVHIQPSDQPYFDEASGLNLGHGIAPSPTMNLLLASELLVVSTICRVMVASTNCPPANHSWRRGLHAHERSDLPRAPTNGSGSARSSRPWRQRRRSASRRPSCSVADVLQRSLHRCISGLLGQCVCLTSRDDATASCFTGHVHSHAN